MATLILRARQGDAEAIGQVLEHYRRYLRTIARRGISPVLQRRVDASDLVQQTLIEAYAKLDAILPGGDEQLRIALRQILRCNLSNAIRDHLYTEKRNARREQPLEGAMGLHGTGSTPSVSLARREEISRFLQHFDTLPPDQADAVRMRYFEGFSVDEIAVALDRTRMAAAGLLKRGLMQLRAALSADHSSQG